jgi:hypothetical protein
VLAGNVPERSVDRSDCRHIVCATPEKRGTVHLLPMVFDPEWVFSNQVLGELVYGSGNTLRFSFKSAFCPTFKSGIGCYSNQARAISRCELINSGDFHVCFFSGLTSCPKEIATRMVTTKQWYLDVNVRRLH